MGGCGGVCCSPTSTHPHPPATTHNPAKKTIAFHPALVTPNDGAGPSPLLPTRLTPRPRLPLRRPSSWSSSPSARGRCASALPFVVVVVVVECAVFASGVTAGHTTPLCEERACLACARACACACGARLPAFVCAAQQRLAKRQSTDGVPRQRMAKMATTTTTTTSPPTKNRRAPTAAASSPRRRSGATRPCAKASHRPSPRRPSTPSRNACRCVRACVRAYMRYSSVWNVNSVSSLVRACVRACAMPRLRDDCAWYHHQQQQQQHHGHHHRHQYHQHHRHHHHHHTHARALTHHTHHRRLPS